MQRVRDSLVSLPISNENSTTIIVMAVDNLGNAMQPATSNGVLIDIPAVEGYNFNCSLTFYSFLCPVLIIIVIRSASGSVAFFFYILYFKIMLSH